MDEGEIELKEGEGSQLAEFVSRAVRTPKQGIFEHLLCQHLASAVLSNPLRKIRLICEAAMMVPQELLDVDWELVKTIHAVALGFMESSKPHIFPIPGSYQPIIYYQLVFPFHEDEENFNRFIKPWLRSLDIRCWTPASSSRREEERQKNIPLWSWFFWVVGDTMLTEASFNKLKAQFLRWALPKCQEIFRKLSELVNPSLYSEILATMTREISEKKPAKPSVEEPTA